MHTFQWNSFSYFFSAHSTQFFLKNCYRKRGIELADQKAYENCYPFIYYIEHGKIYYEQAKIAPLIIKPILLFYGLVHLIKACILTVDPNYPETTSVLAHGVSTRKRKKQQYSFVLDEVKFQKTGLFPFVAEKLFHMKHLEGDKISMGSLLKQVPELSDLVLQFEGKPSFAEVNQNGEEFSIPKHVLDVFHMTENRFIDFFLSKSMENFSHQRSEDQSLIFNKKGSDYLPLKYDLSNKSFALPLTKGIGLQFHELIIHYLLLYNLSMIARYETEWWSELVKTMPNQDYPLIDNFLYITTEKGPYLVHHFLDKAASK
ncbi:YaaC family protein [Robertmurraya andreesenii]|uniref:YaaC-like Protein n=1 Tax=Anoxybacillus andreesenii TaxID=1325932 RepID=A0ABT9VA93_9BACL|nr:YaaC family protein [Robertmurraya andreesenii]MDQ0157884.1 hypothetical protein [Robertmurraya andreesenii]